MTRRQGGIPLAFDRRQLGTKTARPAAAAASADATNALEAALPARVEHIFPPDRGMYFILRLTQLIVRLDSRLGVLRYKIAPKCLLPGPFGHSGVGGNPGVERTVRSYNLPFTYPYQPPPPPPPDFPAPVTRYTPLTRLSTSRPRPSSAGVQAQEPLREFPREPFSLRVRCSRQPRRHPPGRGITAWNGRAGP